MTLVMGDMTSAKMTFGRLDRLPLTARAYPRFYGMKPLKAFLLLEGNVWHVDGNINKKILGVKGPTVYDIYVDFRIFEGKKWLTG